MTAGPDCISFSWIMRYLLNGQLTLFWAAAYTSADSFIYYLFGILLIKYQKFGNNAQSY